MPFSDNNELSLESFSPSRFITRLLLAVAVVLFVTVYARSSEPPVALLSEPPAAKVAANCGCFPCVCDSCDCAPTNAKKACVSVWNATTNSAGVKFGGSGVCIACEGTQSIVVTNNHIFSERHHPEGGFYDDIYPVAAQIVVGDKTYKATAVAADRLSDICVVIVDGALTPAKIADAMPREGEKVWRQGNGTGYQTGEVIATNANPTQPRFSFEASGKSASGDSGSPYFNAKDELVAIHCGQTSTGAPRGTPVTSVKVVVKQHTPHKLFPRLRARLGAKTTVVVPSQPEPPAAAVPPKKLEKVDPPKVLVAPAAPLVQYRLVTYTGRFGRTYQQWEAVGGTTAGGCVGGNCPLR
jgi:S1-C subfamily serine protease